ncbi:MAG: protein-L-isoaspartate(D-aspartate) O-methyltransferase [Candidatus Firestonebacteria bacterium]
MKRKEMVDNQIIARGIKDKKVLDALYKVERHRFVSEELINQAYDDNPLPIGEGQTISQPYIVAIMTELAELKEDDKVLEIGTGSGYQAAVLAEIAKEVYTIEIIESLAKGAEKKLNESGYKNIKVKCGDGFLGWEEHSPYDVVIVTCAPSKIPEPLLNQLKEGGRLIIPVGDVFQELKRARKVKGKLKEESIIPVRFVPMTGDEIKKRR